jgi:hypothetical protein
VGDVSAVFQVFCQTCETSGPKIRRTAGLRAVLCPIDGPATKERREEAADEWGSFLSEHEFHQLRLDLGP